MRVFKPLLLAFLAFIAGPAQSAILFFARCESTTLDGTHDFSAGDTTWDANSTSSSFASGAGMVGTNGLLITSAPQVMRMDLANDIVLPSQGSFAFLFRFTAWPAFTKLVAIRGSTTDYQFSVWTHASSDVMVAYLGNDEGTNINFNLEGLNLQTNTIYGVVYRWNQSTGTFRLEVYSSPLTSPSLIAGAQDTTGWTVFPDMTRTGGFSWGDNSGGVSTENVHFDNIMVSDTYGETLQDFLQYTSYTQFSSSSSALLQIIQQH